MNRPIAPPLTVPIAPDHERLLFDPNVRIHGPINDQTVSNFLLDLKAVRDSGEDLYVEIDTPGGDADGGRRMALEIGLFLKHSGRNGLVVGKNTVYSAGVTVFAAFPKQSRFLCRQAVLLIHERRLEKQVALNGPITSCLQIIREQLALLETAEKLEGEGFAALVAGSHLSLEELRSRALTNCYIMSKEALELGLVADIVD
jgi:ATP-dependent protease ClpP protease subunit